jgi:hypothetical protein
MIKVERITSYGNTIDVNIWTKHYGERVIHGYID